MHTTFVRNTRPTISFAKHSTQAILMALGITTWTPTTLAEDIASCIDENGVPTFTDIICYEKGAAEKPLHSSPVLVAPSKPIKSKKSTSPVTSSMRINTTEPNDIIKDVQSQCSNRLSNFLNRKHKTVLHQTNVEFNEILDQYVNGTTVSVTLRGIAEYQMHSTQVQSQVECTMQRYGENSDWSIGYSELPLDL